VIVTFIIWYIVVYCLQANLAFYPQQDG